MFDNSEKSEWTFRKVPWNTINLANKMYYNNGKVNNINQSK